MKKLLLISLLLCSFAGVAKAQIVTSTSLNINKSEFEKKPIVEKVKPERLPAEQMLTAEIEIYHYDYDDNRSSDLFDFRTIALKYSRYLNTKPNGWVAGYGGSILSRRSDKILNFNGFTGWRTTKYTNEYTEFTVGAHIGWVLGDVDDRTHGVNFQLARIANHIVYGINYDITDYGRSNYGEMKIILGYKF